MATIPSPFVAISSGAVTVTMLTQGAAAPWLPGDNTLLGAVGDGELYRDSTTTTAGTVYLIKLPVRQPQTITNLLFHLSTAGAGASTGSFAGLYSSAGGAALSGSADIAASLTGATGIITIPLTTPQAITGGAESAWPWAAFLANLATTQPTLANSAAPAALANVNLSAANFRTAVNGTGLLALPSITPSSNTAAGSSRLWVGWS